MICKVGDIDRLRGRGHQVTDELVACGGGDHENDCLRDGGMSEQHRLDFTEFDALSAELDLEIGPADVLEDSGAVGPGFPAHEVARAVHPFAGCSERVREEAIGGQVRTIQITTCELNTRQVELAWSPDRNRAQTPV